MVAPVPAGRSSSELTPITARVPAVSRLTWWVLLVVTLGVILLWPPQESRSLAVQFVNWVVDPAHRLPVLPPQLGFGVGDDPQVVEARDAEVRRYDEAYNAGGWTRLRLHLKVATDPFEPHTERQLLLFTAALTWFIAWRWSGGVHSQQRLWPGDWFKR